MNKATRFIFSNKANVDFTNLSTILKKRIINKLEYFEKSENPLSFAKKLKGTENKFRFRIGDYRIIISKIDEERFVILLILKIAHRREVYE
jgi:mRNA interferase RelE/StbE